MRYEGIGPEQGAVVQQEDAFGYACERCLAGTWEEQETFMEIFREVEEIHDFARELIEWFFSGNWISVKEDDTDEFTV